MKNILLLLTDFSPESNYAFDIALLMAQCSGSQLLLLHCPTQLVAVPASGGSSPADDQVRASQPALESPETIKRRLHNLIVQGRQRAPHVPVQQLIATARADVAVPDAIREHNVDLLVRGAHQHISWKRFFLSPHTMQLMRDADCPVLTVKHPTNGFDLQHVVFASDFSSEADLAAPTLHLLLELFPEASLHLLDIVPSTGHSDRALAAIHSFARRHAFGHYEPDVSDAPRTGTGLPRFDAQDFTDYVVVLTYGCSMLGHVLPASNTAKAERYAIPPIPKTPS